MKIVQFLKFNFEGGIDYISEMGGIYIIACVYAHIITAMALIVNVSIPISITMVLMK